jgi:GrpB-like predicted nucleotidyltransferase (UPF0157 family)
MDNTLDEADGRFRTGAFRLRLREDLISMRIRYLRRGQPTESDCVGLFDIHREAMGNLHSLQRRHPQRAGSARHGSAGLADTAVEVVDYDDEWPGMFETDAADIRRSLGSYAVAVHHVGSTSIPGMPAKPIVDIAVAVESDALRSHLPECIGAMRAVGYDYFGDWGHHGGHYFGKFNGSLRTRAAQLHPADSPDLADLLDFRDAARTNPSLLREYAQMKLALAMALAADRGLYVWYKGHWLNDRLPAGAGPRAWCEHFLRAQYPTLVQLGLRGLASRLRPRFAGRGLHPMALREPRRP